MNLDLKDKVVIVTGGGAGIGGAISKHLAAEGAKIAIIGRSPLHGEFIKELKAIDAKYLFKQLDLMDEKACAEAISDIADHFGKIDGLVNNAGVNDNMGLENSVAEFRQSLEKSLVHYFTMAHYTLPHLVKTRGSIVNIGSKTAVTGQGHTSGYAAANGGRMALTREWAAALLDQGIRVNAVIPAEVMTPLYEKWIQTFKDPNQQLKKITANIPLGKRMTTVDEIANTVVFLLSDRASHTTGQHLFVDGGYTHLDRAITA
ncbi:L-fucose dehydrogenase [Bartonella sp. LJL80]